MFPVPDAGIPIAVLSFDQLYEEPFPEKFIALVGKPLQIT
jgi:hypothetical protein